MPQQAKRLVEGNRDGDGWTPRSVEPKVKVCGGPIWTLQPDSVEFAGTGLSLDASSTIETARL